MSGVVTIVKGSYLLTPWKRKDIQKNLTGGRFDYVETFQYHSTLNADEILTFCSNHYFKTPILEMC